MIVLATSFFSGVICNSLNFTIPCICTMYCIKNATKNIGVSKNTLLIISFKGYEFEFEFEFYFFTAAFDFDMNIQNMVARRKMNEIRFEFMYAILRLSYQIELPGE